MNLNEYIASLGTVAFAMRFGISVRTAEAYRQRRRLPRPHFAEKVISVSPVTWEGIYRPGGERTPVKGMRPRLRRR